jgi:hypothetical protein
MRFFGTALVVGLLLFGADRAASAQGYCPFLAFCDAQHHQCHQNCGALTDVIHRPDREAFLQYCFGRCDVLLSRCAARNTRRCLRRWH